MKKGQGGSGSNNKKTNKPAPGPDIPSSNFKGKSAPNANRSYANLDRSYANVGTKQTTAPPIQALQAQDPARLLSHLSRVDKNLQEIIGPTVYDWKKLAEKKKKEELAKQKEELSQRRLQKQEELKNPELAQQRAKEEEEAKKKAEEAKQEEKPKKIFTDSQGRIVDEEGNTVNLKQSQVSSLQVNQNIKRKKRVEDMLRMQRITGQDSLRNTAFFDPTLQPLLASKREKRRLQAFHFIEKGSISQQAETIRKNDASTTEEKSAIELGDQTMETETARLDENERRKKKSESSILQAGLKRVSVRVKRHDPIPDVEWWDLPLLKEGEKSYIPKDSLNTSMVEEEPEGNRNEYGSIQQLKSNLQLLNNLEYTTSVLKLVDAPAYHPLILSIKDKITALIEHPAAFRNNLTGQHISIPTYLTKEERKKIRRQKRQEKEKDKQDKIRLGFIQPPPPKLKLTNYMKILGDEAVADPTRVEREVQKQVADRLKAHKERNAKKKLTKEQKAEKSLRKLKRDSALECRVAIFRVADLSNRSNRFKVDQNANQMAINGFCFVVNKNRGLDIPSVVIVEGGPKAIKFYKKLMLRRIKWGAKDDDGTASQSNLQESMALKNSEGCQLVWEGAVKDHSFNKWRVADIKSELEGRRALAERGVEFYWDIALNNAAIEDEEHNKKDEPVVND